MIGHVLADPTQPVRAVEPAHGDSLEQSDVDDSGGDHVVVHQLEEVDASLQDRE